MLPNFLIVGAAKSGTTALYYYLDQHPDIYFPDLKEPKYFSSKGLNLPHQGVGDKSVDRYRVTDKKKYEALFKTEGQKLIGEASPEYIYYHKETSEAIYNELGDIPIIIILRNPAKRAFSAYAYLKRDSREKLEFLDALEQEEQRRADNWDFIWHYKNGGLYYEQVKSYKERFSRVLVLTQEGMKKDTLGTVNQTFEFLGIEPKNDIDVSISHNPSGEPQNFFAKLLLSRSNPISPYLREFAKAVVPRNILERSAAKSMTKIEMKQEDYESLKIYFRDDITRLEQYLGVSFDAWKS